MAWFVSWHGLIRSWDAGAYLKMRPRQSEGNNYFPRRTSSGASAFQFLAFPGSRLGWNSGHSSAPRVEIACKHHKRLSYGYLLSTTGVLQG